MEEHIRVEHSYFPYAPVNTCTHCGSCFNSCSEVSSHEYKTHSLTLSCPFCGILRRDKEHLQMHVVIHLSPLTYVCMKCQEHFSTVDDVEFHIFKNHGESALWADYLKCRFCHCLFEKREKLYSHIINLHSRIFSHKCNSCLQTFYNQNALLVHRSNEHNILEGQKIVADEHFKIDFRKLRVRLDESTKDNVALVNRRLVKIQKKKIFGAGLTGKESDDEREEDKVYLEEKLPEVIGISVDDTDEAVRSVTIASDPFCAASSTGAVLGASKCIQASTVTTEGLKNDVDLLSFARGIPVLKQKPSEEPNISTDVDVSTVSNVSERIKQENSSDASNIDHAMVVQLQRNLEEAQERLKALEEAIHMQKTGESNVLHVQENKPNVTQRLSSTDEDDFSFLSPRKMQHKDDQGRFKRIVIYDDSDGVNDEDDGNDDDDEDEKNGHSKMISKPKHSGTIKLNHRNCSIMEILEVKHKIMEVLCFRSPRLVLHRCDHLLNREVTSDTKSDNKHLSPDSARSPTNSNSQSEEEDTEKQPPIKGIVAKRGRPPSKRIGAKRGRPPLKGIGAKRDREISKSSSSPNKVAAKVLSPSAELIGILQPRSTRTRRNLAALTDHDDGSNHHSSKCKDNRFSSKYQKQKSEARKKKEEAQKKRIIGLRSRTKSLGLRSHRKNSEEGDDGEALRKVRLIGANKFKFFIDFHHIGIYQHNT
ncbi:hypothetical protein FSP39_001647 [Pinctada imbricata]|uniref:C2H2-type domain-containing protein n=1 Tax=Pinctada imbricata TaxID=66713 RepID=A0AA89BTW0_PINIB|nr:hypothetical protein FSP39_001647 [Pinctada imbricata]